MTGIQIRQVAETFRVVDLTNEITRGLEPIAKLYTIFLM